MERYAEQNSVISPYFRLLADNPSNKNKMVQKTNYLFSRSIISPESLRLSPPSLVCPPPRVFFVADGYFLDPPTKYCFHEKQLMENSYRPLNFPALTIERYLEEPRLENPKHSTGNSTITDDFQVRYEH